MATASVKIVLDGEDSIVLEAAPGTMTIEAPSADQSYSPFHMLGSALATCTFSVLHSWAEHAGFSAGDLRIRVEWDFAEEPLRVEAMRMKLEWPSLPAQRRRAAERAAELCTIHATLQQPVAIGIESA